MDARYRELQKLAEHDPSYAVPFLQHRLRVGDLSIDEVKTWAYFGDTIAQQVTGEPPALLSQWGIDTPHVLLEAMKKWMTIALLHRYVDFFRAFEGGDDSYSDLVAGFRATIAIAEIIDETWTPESQLSNYGRQVLSSSLSGYFSHGERFQIFCMLALANAGQAATEHEVIILHTNYISEQWGQTLLEQAEEHETLLSLNPVRWYLPSTGDSTRQSLPFVGLETDYPSPYYAATLLLLYLVIRQQHPQAFPDRILISEWSSPYLDSYPLSHPQHSFSEQDMIRWLSFPAAAMVETLHYPHVKADVLRWLKGEPGSWENAVIQVEIHPDF